MKKHIVLGLISGTVAAAMMLSGFDSAMTVQELHRKSQEAQAAKNSATVSMQMEADAALQIGADSSTATKASLNGNADLTISYTLDPFQMKMEGNVKGTALGNTVDATLSEYFVTDDDGSGIIYANLDTGNGGSWEASRVGKDQMRTVQEALEASKSGDYSKLKEQGFDAQALLDQVEKVTTLAPEVVTTGNQECYEMTSTISGSLLSGMLTDVMNSSLSNASGDGLDDQKRQIAEDILKSLSVNTKEDYNTETFLPVHMEMDLSGSDFSGLVSRIESLIRAGYTGSAAEPEEPQLSVTVNTLKASADYDFDTPVSIEVPEEARNTPVSESGLSADAVKGKAAGIDADQLIPDTDSQQET
ncbi:MAG TPA: hypothetical protein DHV79_02675 [Lachnospiraceae bacterium]|nr:hypothetical protein [Lachnospiraceae bacterium]